MGNIQSAPISRVIPTMDSVFDDVPGMTYVQDLSKTRFMKVSRVTDHDHPAVAKVFFFPDTFSLTLFDVKEFTAEIERIQRQLAQSNASNCIGYTYCIPKHEKFIILTRPFHKDTLYDRLYARPFLADVEKRWLAFQLLKALAQCRRAKIYHGDIKPHNILVSSSNWLNLTDFASFKPTRIPCDTPSAFTFFFNASRHSCCLAPERLRPSSEYTDFNSVDAKNTHDLTRGRTDAMDIFSTGCVLVELFTDGRKAAFERFGQLVDYMYMDSEDAQNYIEGVVKHVPEDFRPLIRIMFHQNPDTRKQLYDEYEPFRPDGPFPPIFESFLYHYMAEFRTQMSARKHGEARVLPKSPDDVITKLYVEKSNFLPKLAEDKSNSTLLLIALVTSNIRSCRSISAKMDAICLLQELSKYTTEAVIAERVVPYLVKMITDLFVIVQTEAIHVLTDVLYDFKTIPPHDTRLLVDFVLVKLRELLNHSRASPITIMAIASNLGRLALTAYRFFEASRDYTGDEEDTSSPQTREERQKQAANEQDALCGIIREMYAACFHNPAVSPAIMDADNIQNLCLFFYRVTKKADDILDHMISVHNKNDWRLIVMFFKNSPIIAQYLSPTENSLNFYPLITPGLQHRENTVVLAALQCILELCRENRNWLELSAIWNLCKFIVPFVVHPNIWLRLTTVQILKVLDGIFPFADVFCRLIPMLQPFLKIPLLRLNDIISIHESLVEPISPAAWKLVTTFCYEQNPSAVKEFFGELRRRDTVFVLNCGDAFMPASQTSSVVIDAVYGLLTKLASQTKSSGELHELEVKLLAFECILSPDKKHSQSKGGHSLENILCLSDLPILRTCNLSGEVLSSSIMLESRTSGAVLEALLSYRRDLFEKQRRTSAFASKMKNGVAAFSTPTDKSKLGKPEIRVVANLHEHSKKVTRITVHADRKTFASSSVDGTVKIWSLNQVPGFSLPSALASVQTISRDSPVNAVEFMSDNENHLVCGFEDGVVSLFDVEGGSFLNRSIDSISQHGAVTSLSTAGHLIYVLSEQSVVHCFDKRMPVPPRQPTLVFEPLFSRRARNSLGFITSMAIDPVNQHWLALTSTSSRGQNIVLYDLRFLALEVDSWCHPTHKLIRRAWPLVSSPSTCKHLATAVTREGEVCIWDLEGGESQNSCVLWPGGDPVLTYANDLQTTALAQSRDLGGIFTGDSFGSLRFWSFDSTSRCNYLSGKYRPNLLASLGRVPDPPNGIPQSGLDITYERLQTNQPPTIIRERRPPVMSHSPSKGTPPTNPLGRASLVGDHHRDAITDLGLVGKEYLVSSGRDGIVKVWNIL